MPDIEIRFGYRQTGRTERLIEWLIESEPDKKRMIVSHSYAEAKRLYKLSVEQCSTVEDWQFTSLDRPRLMGKNVSEIGIDNLELMLSLLGGHVAPVTMVVATLAQPDANPPQPGFNVRVTM